MNRQKTFYAMLLFLFVLAGILAGIIWHDQRQALKVVFFDVGQGDAILIQKGNNQVLIDGGPDGKRVMEKLGEYIPFWDRKIEVVIATHPDQDHIDGLVDVMNGYQIGEVIDNGVTSDSQIYKKYKSVIDERKIAEIEGRAGMEINLGGDARLEIMSPDGKEEKDNPKDTNISSIVSKLTYMGHSFLFTGDFTADGELALLGTPKIMSQGETVVAGASDSDGSPDWRAEVLKVGHHGSRYSTSVDFLGLVRPNEAVISVGKNNRYGHPAGEIIDRLSARKINIKRTDLLGDVEYDY